MNLKEIEYIVKIAEYGNITHAAKKLFITPSALNQQLLHLEKEIGTQLFQRLRTGWLPTEAGKIYLEGAYEILRIKKETYQRLQDNIDIQKGILAVSFPPERGSYMFTNVYPVFHKRYPNIVVTVKEMPVRMQQEMIAKGEVDIGFLTLRPSHQTGDVHIPICHEELVLVVPSKHPIRKKAKKKDNSKYPEVHLSDLSDEPFALIYKTSTIYECTNQIFRDAGFVPNVLFETSRAATILTMVSSGLCCSIVPDSESLQHIRGVTFLSLDTHPTWELVASYKRGSYLSEPAKYFISLASQYWNGLLPENDQQK